MSTKEHVDKAKQNCLASSVINSQTFAEAPEFVECPFELEHVWSWFNKLDAKRQNGMAHNPISSVEIAYWFKLHKIQPSVFEIEALEAIDRAYLTYIYSRNS